MLEARERGGQPSGLAGNSDQPVESQIKWSVRDDVLEVVGVVIREELWTVLELCEGLCEEVVWREVMRRRGEDEGGHTSRACTG